MNKKRLASLGIAAALVVGSFTAGVVAEGTIKEITAQIDYSMKIQLNGKAFSPIDSTTGKEQKAILYDGRSYLPVRAIAEAFNVPVDYSSANNTIILGLKDTKTDLCDLRRGDWMQSPKLTTDEDLLSIHGKYYKRGMYDELTSMTYDKFRLKKNYQKLSLTLGVVGASGDVNIELRDNDTLVKKFTVSEKDGMKTVEVNVAGIDELEFKATGQAKKLVIADSWVN